MHRCQGFTSHTVSWQVLKNTSSLDLEPDDFHMCTYAIILCRPLALLPSVPVSVSWSKIELVDDPANEAHMLNACAAARPVRSLCS